MFVSLPIDVALRPQPGAIAAEMHQLNFETGVGGFDRVEMKLLPLPVVGKADQLKLAYYWRFGGFDDQGSWFEKSEPLWREVEGGHQTAAEWQVFYPNDRRDGDQFLT